MDKEQGSSLHTFKSYQFRRSIEVELILEPGNYMIVPLTSGCRLKRPENAEIEEIKLMDNVGHFHPQFKAAIEEIFNRIDLVISHTIDYNEFNGFLEMIGKPPYNE
jgi:hypothetical protein